MAISGAKNINLGLRKKRTRIGDSWISCKELIRNYTQVAKQDHSWTEYSAKFKGSEGQQRSVTKWAKKGQKPFQSKQLATSLSFAPQSVL